MSIKNTAIIQLALKVADSTQPRLLRETIRGIDLPLGNIYERKYSLDPTVAQPVTHLGTSGAKVTVLIPNIAMNVTLQIGVSSIVLTDVSWPIVLPASITSAQFSCVDPLAEGAMYVFQGS